MTLLASHFRQKQVVCCTDYSGTDCVHFGSCDLRLFFLLRLQASLPCWLPTTECAALRLATRPSKQLARLRTARRKSCTCLSPTIVLLTCLSKTGALVDIETALSNKFAGTIDFGTQLEDRYNLTRATCTDLSACLERAELQGIDIMTDLREVSGCQRCIHFDGLAPALYCGYHNNSHSCLRRCGQAMLFTSIACAPASVAILVACCAARRAVVFTPTSFDTV
eukprot:COSAG02_NODE_709_length_18217_cov_13.019704_8_plen_223_part_00